MKLYEVIDILVDLEEKYGGSIPVTLSVEDGEGNYDDEGHYIVEDILADEYSVTLYNC